MSDGKSGVIPDRMSESLPNRMSDRLPNRMPAKCQIEWKNNMSHRMTEYYIYICHMGYRMAEYMPYIILYNIFTHFTPICEITCQIVCRKYVR